MLVLAIARFVARRAPLPAVVRLFDRDGAERLWERFDDERQACAFALGRVREGGFALVSRPGRWRCVLVIAGGVSPATAIGGLSRSRRLGLALRARVLASGPAPERALP